MFLIYLFCLLFGGAFLTITFLLGHGANGDSGGDGHGDVGGDAHVGMDGHAYAGTGSDLHAHPGTASEDHPAHEGEGVAAAIKYLSLRNVVFFTAFFGLTGSTLSWLGIWPPLTFMSALAMGVFAATLSQKLLSYLKKTEVGAVSDLSELAGLKAKVLVDISKTRRGKIAVKTRDRILQLLAVTAEESKREEFGAGETVTIIRTVAGIAHVADETFLDL
jgi:hypothetical protein